MRNVSALAHSHLLTDRCQQSIYSGKLIMKRLGFLLLLSVSVSARSHSALPTRPVVILFGGTQAVSSATPTEIVYVCMSKGSVAYHSRGNCAGINSCTHEVKRMSAADAQGLGKRACLKCY